MMRCITSMSNATNCTALFPISKTTVESKEVKDAVGTPGVVEKKVNHTFLSRYVIQPRNAT